VTDSPRRILVLADDSPAAAAAVRSAARIAEVLQEPLTILGVARRAGEDDRIEAALAEAFAAARSRVASVEVTRATGELLEVSSRRLAESPSSLVVAGARWHAGAASGRLSPAVWALVQSLQPPVLVTPAREGDFASALFCTGGERFIEDGARFAARLLAAMGVPVTVFHVLPPLPGMYGDRMRDEETDVADFIASGSRSARNVQRQVEIFRAAGAAVTLRLATGDVADRVLDEVRRGGHDLLVVGSSPERGRLRAYMLGDLTREIVGRAGRAFLVVRSRPPGLFTELWRSLKEGAAEGAAGKDRG
jgi:nucleotide-binding universal stress UspA family protein